MATTPFAGNQGKITCGGTAVHVTKWTAAAEAPFLDTTDSSTAGYQTGIAGIKKLQATFDGWYDSTNPPFASPPNLNPGASITFALYLKDSSGPQITGTGICTNVTVNSVVNAVVNFSGTLESTGSFSLPTTTF
jgi:hypothetical protein